MTKGSTQISWQRFSAAPHRMFFFAGALQALLTILWWLLDLGGRYINLYPAISWGMSAIDIHAFLMIYGFFSFFIFGFLMTTYPRWMQGEEIERPLYISTFTLMSAGMVLCYLTMLTGGQFISFTLLVFLSGWTQGLVALMRVYFKAKHPDKKHAAITSLMLLSAWFMLIGFISGDSFFIQLAKTGGVWLFLLPLFFAVSHRMIPFFSANVVIGYTIIRPYWALFTVLALAAVHLVLELSSGPQWLWLCDLPMACIGLYLTFKWQILKSLKVPLLAMLHISFAWFGIALSLYTLQSFYLFITDDYILLRAPLHALVIGYFGSMLIAMATRVTLGHSGRPLAADKISWGIFLTFQFVALSRVMADLPTTDFSDSNYLYITAGVIWLTCFSVWAYKFIPVYLLPRVDGKTG